MSDQPVKPNLFIVGAAKCGTTTLHDALSMHPSIFMSRMKEPHFFSGFGKDFSTSHLIPTIGAMNQYMGLFDQARNYKFIGESSTSYLWSARAPKEIHAFNERAVIIIILRNPVDRCISHHLNNLREGFDTRPLEVAIKEEIHATYNSKYRSPMFRYLEYGLYHDQVARYLDLFGKSVHLLHFEDFFASVERCFNDLLGALELEAANFNISSLHKNQAGDPRNRWVETILKVPAIRRVYRGMVSDSLRGTIRTAIFKKHQKTTGRLQIRQYLEHFYRNEIARMGRLVPSASKWLASDSLEKRMSE